jgi:hypothetical protein
LVALAASHYAYLDKIAIRLVLASASARTSISMSCQATGETDPLPTLKLTPPDLMFSVNQREPAAPASAHSDPKLHGIE